MPITPIEISPTPHDTSIGDRTRLFFESFNQDLLVLNEEICRYNQLNDSDNRFEALKRIYQQRLNILNRYPLKRLITYPTYYPQLLNTLWEALKKEFSSLDVVSLTDLQTLDRRALPPPSMTREFADILSNMPQAKCEQFMRILLRPFALDGLLTLYKPEDPGYATFQSFLKQNTFELLGGKNSKIYKITPKDPSHPRYILKVDGRLTLPKAPELYLRSQGTLALTRTYGQERQVAIKDARNIYVSTLLIGDYFPQRDLFSQIQRDHLTLSIEKNYIQALNRALQMGEVFQDMQKKGVAFPDAKNENWLIDPQGQLKIADTKSFLFIEKDGRIHMKNTDSIGRNQWQSLCTTYTHRPGEFLAPDDPDKLHRFSVDLMHCYMLGKNFYQMLTGCQLLELTYKPLDFYHQIFTDPEERATKLKKLIVTMTTPNPLKRMSLDSAMEQLKALISEPGLKTVRIQWLQRDCEARLSQLAPLISEEDFYGFTAKINASKTPEGYQMRCNELASALTTVHIQILDQRIQAYQQLLENPKVLDQAELISQLSILHALKTETYSLQQIDALKKTDRLLKRYQRYVQNTQTLDDLKEEARRILNGLAQISPDPPTARYITETFPQIEAETNPINLLKLQYDLKALATRLKKVRQSLNEVLEPAPKPSFFNPLRKRETKAAETAAQSRIEKIKQAFQALPPLDRIQIFSRSTSPIRCFKEALNADEQKPEDCHTEIYRRFKARYPQSIYVPESDDEDEERLAMPNP